MAVRRKTELPEETEALGEQLGALLKQPLVIACFGDLGAGKTTFARGVARGLGAPQDVTSPTFVLQHIYTGRLPMYHFDAYRLSSPRDLFELGWEECDDGIVFLEWSERVQDALPPDRLEIHFENSPAEGSLTSLTFKPFGKYAEEVVAALC